MVSLRCFYKYVAICLIPIGDYLSQMFAWSSILCFNELFFTFCCSHGIVDGYFEPDLNVEADDLRMDDAQYIEWIFENGSVTLKKLGWWKHTIYVTKLFFP